MRVSRKASSRTPSHYVTRRGYAVVASRNHRQNNTTYKARTCGRLKDGTCRHERPKVFHMNGSRRASYHEVRMSGSQEIFNQQRKSGCAELAATIEHRTAAKISAGAIRHKDRGEGESSPF
ncbi:hypothetical protein NPIL_561281 [Nephila pilipes]|uniref:Uncharacterized protein n=1 Tax=Nephila pilipes TaxID=299642 RepID=A0A8X6UMZ9_NEPPI|nr:hypothetical protein NPIL_561281 [Nephila pilipes]